MEVLVIGGTGFIGSNLVRHLSSAGYGVRIYRRETSSLQNLRGLAYSDIVGEVSDEGSLGRAIQGCGAIFNLAACTSSLKKYDDLRQLVNVRAAGMIARLVRKNGKARLIHISSIAAIGIPRNGEIVGETFKFNWHKDSYAYTKYLGDKEMLKEVDMGLDGVIACPGSVVGCWGMKDAQRGVFKNIATGSMALYPPGGLCLTDVDDVSKGLELCLTKGARGKRYILGGHNIPYKRYFDEIARATGGKKPWIRLPRTILPLMGMMAETVFGLLGKEPVLSRDTCEVISSNLFYSSDLAKRELGYRITDFSRIIEKAAKIIKE